MTKERGEQSHPKMRLIIPLGQESSGERERGKNVNVQNCNDDVKEMKVSRKEGAEK